MLGGERPTRPRPGGNTPPAGGNTQAAAPTPENTPARPPRRATYGKQYWLLDPATGIYSNVPEGTEGAIASGQRPPNETPGGTERVVIPDDPLIPAGGMWERLGLMGGNGTDYWMDQVLKNMQANPAAFGLDPGEFDDAFARSMIEQWNARPQEERLWIAQNVSGGNQSDINAGYEQWDLDHPDDGGPPPPPPPGENLVIQRTVPRNTPGSGTQTWVEGQGQEAFAAAYEEWRNSGMQGPRPQPLDFGAVQRTTGRGFDWPDPNATPQLGGVLPKPVDGDYTQKNIMLDSRTANTPPVIPASPQSLAGPSSQSRANESSPSGGYDSSKLTSSNPLDQNKMGQGQWGNTRNNSSTDSRLSPTGPVGSGKTPPVTPPTTNSFGNKQNSPASFGAPTGSMSATYGGDTNPNKKFTRRYPITGNSLGG